MDTSDLTQRELDLFNFLVRKARQNERAPTGEQLRYRYGHIAPAATLLSLAEKGFIKSEVYGHNWRVIEIQFGPHDGARTQESPYGSPPYYIVSKEKRGYIDV